MKNLLIKFKDSLIRFVKGIVIGVAMIIPGVSGGTLAVLLNLYDELIDSINNLFKNFKKSVLFLLPILIGALVGFIALIYPLSYGLEKCPLIIVSLFAGLIIGGIPQLYRKVKGNESIKGIILSLIAISIMIGLCFVVTNIEINLSSFSFVIVLYLLLGGVLAACALVVPGISGSMIMMILGLYNPILLLLKEILSFTNLGNNILVLIPLVLGFIIGFFSIAKLMGFLLKKHTINTYYSIVGFVIGSIFTIYFVTISDSVNPIKFNALTITLSLLCLIGGFLLTFFLEKKLVRKENTNNEIR